MLAATHRVVSLDAPGHGRSAAVEADLPTGADMMVSAAVEVTRGPATWLGYSMGGRYALQVALRHPVAVRRLILVSTTAGIEDEEERARRRRSDLAMADDVPRMGLEAFVSWWLAQPMFEGLSPAAVEGRLDGTAAGLAASLRLAGAGTQEPVWDRLKSLKMPVLVVAGELDPKYTELASRLVSEIGDNASLALMEGAGHACHLEKPGQFVVMVTSWLRSQA
jgi:2-succinyl-6-hydroxy-2,4-cyclohexadiene-1-carboxylate synthase